MDSTTWAHIFSGLVVFGALGHLLWLAWKDKKDTTSLPEPEKEPKDRVADEPGRDEKDERLLVSYLTLRKVVGALGVGLPVALAVLGVLMFESWHVLDSMSDYYHFRTRDIFVGVLFVLAWFLFAYKGYDAVDDRAGDFACLFALGVALCPTGHPGWQGVVHPWSAAGLFFVLAYFSFFLFTKSDVDREDQSPEKRKRNVFYRFCGVAMLVFIVTIGLSYWLLSEAIRQDTNLVFWMEWLALWAFGASWYVKGKTLWKDPKKAKEEKPATEAG